MSPRAPARPSTRDYVSREQVCALLGIRPQTLYAYVSRGWVRSISRPDTKLKLYSREDVERIQERVRARRGHGAVAAAAMRWGDPIIRSAITEITPEGPRYRGRLAIDLARGPANFEAVAELLWRGIWIEEPVVWEVARPPFRLARLAREIGVEHPEAQLLQLMALLALSLGMWRGVPAKRIQQGTAVIAARQLIRMLVGCFGFITGHRTYVAPAPREGVAASIARACGIAPTTEAVAAVDAALVLSADHELSPSTFAARIAASTSADLHACITTAICTHSGTDLGRGCDRIEDLLAEIAGPAQVRKRIEAFQGSGAQVPTFNLPLYPRGDARAEYLIDLARKLSRQKRGAAVAYRFVDEAFRRLEARPGIEMSLVTLARALGLPPRAAGGIFALGRCAGWVAHIMEQRLLGFLMRPRAQYGAADGVVPEPPSDPSAPAPSLAARRRR